MEPASPPRSLPAVLSIAGSDSGANAGIQADLLSFAANGVYGTTALTCITSQNPEGVSDLFPLPPDRIASQIQQVVDYYHPRAIKTGMLFHAPIIKTICDTLRPLKDQAALVVDPVMIASSGAPLLDDAAVALLEDALLPLADLITPNLDETQRLLERPIATPSAIEEAAQTLSARYQSAVLIKGGHLEGDDLIDILALPDGKLFRYHQNRIQNINTHGSGCTLSAAIAAWLAKGASIEEAVREGRDYLRAAMERSLKIRQETFINHFPKRASNKQIR